MLMRLGVRAWGWEVEGEAGGAVGGRLRDADGLSEGRRVPGMRRLAAVSRLVSVYFQISRCLL